jgi:hypothetical protein
MLANNILLESPMRLEVVSSPSAVVAPASSTPLAALLLEVLQEVPLARMVETLVACWEQGLGTLTFDDRMEKMEKLCHWAARHRKQVSQRLAQ